MKKLINQYVSFKFPSYKIGDGDGDDNDKTFTKDEVDSAVSAAVSKATDDLKTQYGNDKKQILADLKKAKDGLKAFEGLDANKMKIMMSAFENDQDLKDIADGKHEEVIKRRIEKKEAEYSTTIEGLNVKNKELSTTNENLISKVSKLMIDNNVVSEFVKEKGVESAIQDIVLRANQIFKVEGDDLIPRNEKGEIITGAKGAMTIKEWVISLKTSAPHLFPGSHGSGASGGGESSAGGLNSEIQAAIKAGDQKKFQQLRKKQRDSQ